MKISTCIILIYKDFNPSYRLGTSIYINIMCIILCSAVNSGPIRFGIAMRSVDAITRRDGPDRKLEVGRGQICVTPSQLPRAPQPIPHQIFIPFSFGLNNTVS